MTTVRLRWTEQSADGGPQGTARISRYFAAYNTVSVTESNFSLSSPINTYQWIPLSPGAIHTEMVTGLPGGTTLFFGIKSLDSGDVVSAVSNSPTATTADPIVGATLTAAPGQLMKTVEEQGTGDARGNDAPAGGLQTKLGQFYLNEIDLVIPGRGLSYRFKRTYRSQIDYDGMLGHNWDHNYSMRLNAELGSGGLPTGNVFLLDGTGRKDFYARNPDGSFTSPPGRYDRLTRNPDVTFTLRTPEGTKRHFTVIDPATNRASLARIVDRNQNQLTFAYDAVGRLTQVTDTLGRVIQYFYNSSGRLDHITDFFGRTVGFAYNSAGDLTSVTSPALTGTPNGNDFPAGKKTAYTYSSGFEDSALNHNLLTITQPNETALIPAGPAVLTSTYGTDASIPREFDRLLTQQVPRSPLRSAQCGESATFFRANYFYQDLNLGADPGDLTIPRNRTTIVDRAGNVTEYEQNVRGATLTLREYTGQINPALSRGTIFSLIPSLNPAFPPIAKLRASDPAFFTTSYAYNGDGEVTQVIHPEGNSTQRFFDTSNADRSAQGNLIEVLRQAGPRGGDGAGGAVNPIVVTYGYEPIFNQLMTRSDPRGNDPDFVPSVNPGYRGQARYTTTRTFDYQEGSASDIQALAAAEGIPLTLAQAQALSLGTDVNGDGLANQQQGNVVRLQAPTVQLAAGGTQAILTLFGYNSRGQPLYRIDPDGSRDELRYYPESDPHGPGAIPPDADTPAELGGYLGRVVQDTTTADNMDNTALNIATEYRYDPVGNVTSILDGRGVRTDSVVNQLNQIVRTVRAADVSASTETGLIAFAYTIDRSYDANDNLIRVDVQNKDGSTDANPFLTAISTYDILANLMATGREVDPSKTVTTTNCYDGNDNLNRFIEPVGNFHTTEYDERDLTFTRTQGASDPNISSTVAYAYDGNGNISRVMDAEDTDGVGGAEEILYTYDGFDRLVKTLDAVGNERIVTYDPAGNQLTLKARGRIGGASQTDNSTANNVDLARSTFQHDELNRRFRTDDEWFISTGVVLLRAPIPVADGFRTTLTDYDAQSRVTRVLNDNNHAMTYECDGLDRTTREIDDLQDGVLFTYDADDNLIETTAAEHRGDDLAAPPETFVTRSRFDALNRLILTVDNINQARRRAYDSRDNVTWVSDGQGPVDLDDPQFGLINRSGNTIRYFLDGLSRNVTLIQDLRIGGLGDGTPSLDGPSEPNVDPTNLDATNPANPDGKITETFAWNDNSRLQSLTDDNGNTTSYLYDSLNRTTQETFADLTTNFYVYDRDNNLRQFTDENGSVFIHAYDAINRRTQTSIAPATDVLGTTLQIFQYDGLSRLTTAADNNNLGSGDDATVLPRYDALSRKIQETQRLGLVSRLISDDFDGFGNRIQLTYPNDRQVGVEFDELERLQRLNDLRIGEPNDIVSYSYIGPRRTLERTYLNGTKLTYLDGTGADIGYDALPRIVRHRHQTASAATVADLTYGFSRENMRLFEHRLHQPAGHGSAKGESYAYDSRYRLGDFKVGDQTASGAIATPDTQSIYNLDGVGNRTFTNKDSVVTNYTPNNMNEYDDVGGTPQTHDANGNLKDDGTFLYAYDAFNRLVEARRKSDNLVIATYLYDAFNRRVSKTVTNSGALDGTTRFLWDGWQEIEERDALNNVLALYVYGSDIDDILTMERAGQTYYYHDDSLGSVEALTDSAGAIVERTTYDAYGASQFTDASFAPIGSISSVGNPFLFTAQRLDPETGFYYFRNRYYSPRIGRFIQRDPLGYGCRSLALQEYSGNNPVDWVDPLGLQYIGCSLPISVVGANQGVTPTASPSATSADPPKVIEAWVKFRNIQQRLNDCLGQIDPDNNEQREICVYLGRQLDRLRESYLYERQISAHAGEMMPPSPMPVPIRIPSSSDPQEGDCGCELSRAEGGEITEEEITRLRESLAPKIPTDLTELAAFDTEYYGDLRRYRVRGHVMEGSSFNYYAVGLAMGAHGFTWELAEQMILQWNNLQAAHVTRGSGNLDVHYFDAARWGWIDARAFGIGVDATRWGWIDLR